MNLGRLSENSRVRYCLTMGVFYFARHGQLVNEDYGKIAIYVTSI